jgi:type I restriction enzyme, S subunit
MKLETFFEKFDQFADAPDAVAKMRELVLELAATGRLVPEVLERPVTEHTKLMGTLVELVMGQAPAGTECNTEGRGTVFVKVGEFGPLYPREEVWTTNPLKFAKKGDVLVCVVGATVGKLNLAIDCAIGRSAAAIRPSSALDTKFLYYSLVPYTLRLRRNSRGSAQGVIGKVELNAVSLWVPSREVQKRIVVKVDELMALCDRLEAQQQERETRHAALARASLARFADAPTPANLHFLFHPSYAISPADLRKSILTLAVQGKLVHRIESEGLAADILKQAGVSEEPPEDLPELPTHWIWARLGSIATRMDSGWSPACIPEPAAEGEWGVLKTTAVQTLQYQEVQNKALPPNLEPRPEHEVMDGDILFTRAGPMNRVGILCVARPTRKKLIISDKIIRFHLVVGIDPDFAALSMNAGFSSTVVEGLKSGMAASQVNISQPKLRSVPIPLPPLAEQRRIVAKVEQLMALVDALELQLAASRATAENLLAAVVAELTEGTHASPAC